MKKFFGFMMALLILALSVACKEGGEIVKEDKTRFPLKTDMKTDGQLEVENGLIFPEYLWNTPESERYDALDNGFAKGYFIRSLNEKWVFCFVGIPEKATAENKVPAVVLVHGGGGTAFFEWVNFWVARGYAAIAMDTEGMMPTENSLMNTSVRTKSIKESGPSNKAFGDYYLPLEEQWGYSGIASVISANSFLRSFTQVDENRVGITGISYGAFLTWQTVAYDDRFVFAAPVYGSPEQKAGDTQWGDTMRDKNGAIGKLWDDGGILKENKTPFLWYNSNKDTFFSVIATSQSDRITAYSSMLLKFNFLHGHDLGGLETKEIVAFADSVCLGSKGLVRVLSQPTKDVFEMKIAIPKDVNIRNVTVFFTKDNLLNDKTAWKAAAGDCTGENISFGVPADASYYYVNIEDERGLEVSSQLIKMN